MSVRLKRATNKIADSNGTHTHTQHINGKRNKRSDENEAKDQMNEVFNNDDDECVSGCEKNTEFVGKIVTISGRRNSSSSSSMSKNARTLWTK